MRIDPQSVDVLRHLPISPPLAEPARPQEPEAAPDVSERRSPFLSRLADAVRQVNDVQTAAATQAERLATGDADSIAGVVLALEKADLTLQLTVQVTQRAVEAYREVSRMQV